MLSTLPRRSVGGSPAPLRPGRAGRYRPPPPAARPPTAGRAGQGRAGRARLSSAQRCPAALVAVLGAEGGTARHGSGGRGGAGAVGRGPAEVSSRPPSRARPPRTDVTGTVSLHFLSRPLVRRPGGLPVHSRAPGWFRSRDAAGSAAPQQVRCPPRRAPPPDPSPAPGGARLSPGAAAAGPHPPGSARRSLGEKVPPRGRPALLQLARRGPGCRVGRAPDAEPGASRSYSRPGRALSLLITSASLCIALPRAVSLNMERGAGRTNKSECVPICPTSTATIVVVGCCCPNLCARSLSQVSCSPTV